ncbi:MAG: hypothetical protein PHO41_03025 [Eubacteriales bacterium]|nr:hypothetical protein [Eubacteriales bacterium]
MAQKPASVKKPVLLCIAAAVLVIIGLVLINWGPAIFQRGNPIPYLIATAGISETQPYVPVNDGQGIYISLRGPCPALFDAVERQYDVNYLEQGGSAYLFAKGERHVTAFSETYWSRYTVWEVRDMS